MYSRNFYFSSTFKKSLHFSPMPMCITGLLVAASSFSAKCVCSIGRIGVKEGTRRRNRGSPFPPRSPASERPTEGNRPSVRSFPPLPPSSSPHQGKGGEECLFLFPFCYLSSPLLFTCTVYSQGREGRYRRKKGFACLG